MESPSKLKSVVKMRGTREVKADKTRRALFSATATVVGKYGYEGASVVKITEVAGVANGTFYNYFKTRQEMFDQLLPFVGDRLLDYIRSRLDRELSGVERERRRIVAYFEFFEQNRGFLRILNEAEIYAPRAFKLHLKKFAARYVNSLKRQLENGELESYREDELETIVYMLMGARTYLTMRWRSAPTSSRKDAGESFISTYVKLVERGLFISRDAASKSVLPKKQGSAAPARPTLT